MTAMRRDCIESEARNHIRTQVTRSIPAGLGGGRLPRKRRLCPKLLQLLAARRMRV